MQTTAVRGPNWQS